MVNDSSQHKVLITPLDWGLGHATRCIPIINEFLKKNFEVQIASSGSALVLLKKEFPELKFHELVSYDAKYSSSLPFMIKILLQMPKFLLAIKKENQQIEKIIAQEKIDLIVSDNRFGCYSDKIPSVIITHQVNILMNKNWRWLQGIINWGNHKQIKKFSQCWIPDFPNGITGKLTQPNSLNAKFIGMLSRFEKKNVEKKYDVLALISGPEPERTVLENELTKQLSNSSFNYFIVRGKPDDNKINESNEANHLNADELNSLIESSDIVVSRSGYTTVMDLWKLNKKAIFIPTPGQTEQEYLAEELMKKKITFYQTQSNFDLKIVLEESKKYKGFTDYDSSSNLLSNSVDEILNSL